MKSIKKPSQKWENYKKNKTRRDLQLQAWRDGIIIVVIMLLSMIRI